MFYLFSDAFDLNFSLVIFRLRAGFDATERMIENPGNAYTTKMTYYKNACTSGDKSSNYN